MPIAAAIFDAFGTVVQIGRKRHPYRQLLRLGALQGRRPSAADLHRLMTSSLDLDAAAETFGICVSPAQMMSLQHDLTDELDSITVYPDAIDALRLLKAEGIATGICSNLAAPYGPVLRQLFSDVHGFALSYKVGEMKPHPGIYRDICHQLGVNPARGMPPSGERVVMIGDSMQCDRHGPEAIGITGFYLDRKGGGAISSLVQFTEHVIEINRAG
ncbi:FMN phosphatase YigB, HAD superfamily [Pseudomonas sp. B10]|uniref:HAD family hydrolase n=1 Tax=Pseudomonas sp. B10 TaxID=118613 RepID=UPI0009537DA4|nr:HAD family hydrolase [Pseudomonas sp. B10]SIR48286.1 FMN phosphatase YigB, HAD superfamily [Pseudomonas sp. B10]